ncbi:MAG: hypothetical protein ACLS6Q_09775 [Christensenellaceae bacterium]
MKKINTHGLKMVGLKKASGSTVNYTDAGWYDEVFYDMGTGEVWTVFQCSLGCNFETVYHDKDIIKICNTDRHMTMQQIADRIAEKISWLKYTSERV